MANAGADNQAERERCLRRVAVFCICQVALSVIIPSAWLATYELQVSIRSWFYVYLVLMLWAFLGAITWPTWVIVFATSVVLVGIGKQAIGIGFLLALAFWCGVYAFFRRTANIKRIRPRISVGVIIYTVGALIAAPLLFFVIRFFYW